MQAYPGTKVYQIAEERGLIKMDYLESLKTPGRENHNIILCDQGLHNQVKAIIEQINWLAFRRTSWLVKLRWVANNITRFPSRVFNGLSYALRALRGRTSQRTRVLGLMESERWLRTG